MVAVSSSTDSRVLEHEVTLWYLRRLVDASPCGFNAGDTNLYRYVGNDPTNATDPTGQARIPIWDRAGEVGDPLDKKRPEIGYIFFPKVVDLDVATMNCYACALGLKPKGGSIFWNNEKGYVPAGLRETTYDLISNGTAAKKGEVQIIVGFVIEKDSKSVITHCVGQDRDASEGGWYSKLGADGEFVAKITDPKAHILWYFKNRLKVSDEDLRKVTFRYFVGKASDLEFLEESRKLKGTK
jgi:hypothetical protein